MNASLLQEREQFKKKAASIPTVKKRKNSKNQDDQGNKKKQKHNASSTKHQDFGALANIVQYLRTNYLGGNQNPVPFEKILKETKQSNINPHVKSWLLDEALKENPKIKVVKGQFMFKAIYKLENCAALVKLLKKHELKGLGGVLWDDIVESLPKAEDILKNLEKRNAITVITKSYNKKKVLFRHEPNAAAKIDDNFKKLWNSITVDPLDRNKVINYLDKHGISSKKDESFTGPVHKKNKKNSKKKSRKVDNEHLADILDTYDDNTLTQKAS